MTHNQKKTRAKRVIKTLVPPILTVAASALILTTAVWVHGREQQADVISTLADVSTVGDDSLHPSPTRPDNTTPNPQSTGSSKNPTNSTTPSVPPKSDNEKPTTNQKQSTPAAQDIGFSPVQGGTVSDPDDSMNPYGGPESSTVTQYGKYPVTTWSGGAAIVGSNKQSYSLPQGVSPKQFVGLTLKQGILWSIIPSTDVTNTGALGSSNAPTLLYYTPYTSAAGQNHNLSMGAMVLGSLPETLPKTEPTLWAGWYSPIQTATDNASGNTTNSSIASTQNAADPSSTSNSPASTDGGDSAPSSASGTGPYVYLKGLYQTSVGAVIAITVNDNQKGINRTWLYLWNESSKSISPLTEIANGNGSYGWFAVGSRVVYFGQRHLLPNNRNYEGKQYLLNVATGKKTQIALGTWSPESYVIKDELVFRVQQSVTWKVFVPDEELLSTTS